MSPFSQGGSNDFYGPVLTAMYSLWREYGIPITIAVLFSWREGYSMGKRGVALKMYIFGAALWVYVAIPVLTHYFSGAGSIWLHMAIAFIAVKSNNIANWIQWWLFKRLGIGGDRRENQDGDS